MKTYVLYHRDADGFCAAWVFSKIFPDALFIDVQYGEDPPEELFTMNASANTFIVDFSYPKEVLQEMSTYSPITVLDHHKSAEEELKGLPYCIFDMSRAGCRMAFDYWKERGHIPDVAEVIVDYVQDHDLWKFELPYSREVRAAIASYPFEFEVWDNFKIDKLIDEGTAILRFKNQMIERHKENAVLIDFCGYKVPMVRTPDGTITSELCGELAEGYPFAIAYFDITDSSGNIYRVHSLRSRGTFDVSEIAKRFGGGGHAKAAGFKIPMPK